MASTTFVSRKEKVCLQNVPSAASLLRAEHVDDVSIAERMGGEHEAVVYAGGQHQVAHL